MAASGPRKPQDNSALCLPALRVLPRFHAPPRDGPAGQDSHMKLPVRRTDGDPGTQGPKSHPPRPGAQEAEALQQEPRQHRGGGGGLTGQRSETRVWKDRPNPGAT